ncbi:GNAT family N-acetyltransferase [Nocardioides hwasunensis]|uniref:GNAT family N-acetyltransferase n=1 Tax=Nocardioides hwasunensis TaxID=397258 RepID=A0ABR8MBA9_9ACTN|nr:GNAT family N-acetyltransferase [Nocardioides hwasunensis]MBD3913422.1 GNAT family N-acetyltransferase [Nocardioides hwasunensis]
MTADRAPDRVVWRRATADDAVALRDLERIASRTGLAHVFGDLPYPDDDVLARWVLLLDDPEVVVEVVGDQQGLIALAAHDGSSLRHLAVRPDHWGSGLGRAGFARAEAAGARRLWVLQANARARALYDSRGWSPTGVVQECPWPPYPTEVEYAAQAPS